MYLKISNLIEISIAMVFDMYYLYCVYGKARSTCNGIGIVKLMGRESGAIALYASLVKIYIRKEQQCL